MTTFALPGKSSFTPRRPAPVPAAVAALPGLTPFFQKAVEDRGATKAPAAAGAQTGPAKKKKPGSFAATPVSAARPKLGRLDVRRPRARGGAQLLGQ